MKIDWWVQFARGIWGCGCVVGHLLCMQNVQDSVLSNSGYKGLKAGDMKELKPWRDAASQSSQRCLMDQLHVLMRNKIKMKILKVKWKGCKKVVVPLNLQTLYLSAFSPSELSKALAICVPFCTLAMLAHPADLSPEGRAMFLFASLAFILSLCRLQGATLNVSHHYINI